MVEQVSHKYKLTVPETGEGTRVDKFLSSALTELSRTRLKSLIEEGQVTLGGVKLTNPSHRVKSGDELKIEVPVPRPPLPKGQAIALNIEFEDDDLIVLEKRPEKYFLTKLIN